MIASRLFSIFVLAGGLTALATSSAFAQTCANCQPGSMPMVQAAQGTGQASIMPAPPNPNAAALPGYNKGDRFYTAVVIQPYADTPQGFDCNWQPIVTRCYGTPILRKYLWEMQWFCENGRQVMKPVWTGISEDCPVPAPTPQVAPGSQPMQPPASQPGAQGVPPPGAPTGSGTATVVPLGPLVQPAPNR